MFSLHALLDALPLLIKAAQATVLILVVGVVGGFIVGMGVWSARLSKNRIASKLGGGYVGFFRGVPLLVQLLLTYYFLPFIGINVPPLVAAAAAVSLCEAAYLAEILRGGFIGIAHGQLEAAQLLGLSRLHAVVRIQVPQALRMTLPSLVNEMVMLVKASSLISVVGVAAITRISQYIDARAYVS